MVMSGQAKYSWDTFTQPYRSAALVINASLCNKDGKLWTAALACNRRTDLVQIEVVGSRLLRAKH